MARDFSADQAEEYGLTPENESDKEPLVGLLTIRGRVIETTGDPVDGIRLIARSQRLFNQVGDEGATAVLAQSVTAGGGYFEFSGLPDGIYSISAGPTAEYAWSQALVRAGSGSALLVLEGQEPLHVAGLVTGERGEPLPGVRITVANVIGASGTYTDPMGQYRLGLELKQGTRSVSLVFDRAGYQDKVVQVSASKGHRNGNTLMQDIRLEPIGALVTVTGTLVGNDGKPVTNESVELFSREAGRLYRAVSDSAGAFLMTGVSTADDYLLRVRPQKQYRDYSEPGLQVGPEGARLTVRLEALGLKGSLTGQMRDLYGNPVPGYALLLQPEGTSNIYLEVASDQSGYFHLADVPAGRVVLQSMHDPRITIRGVEITPGADNEAALVLDIGHQDLHGQVLDEYGKPMSMQPVILSWLHRDSRVDSHASRTTLADQEGRFSFTELGPGNHTLRIPAPGYRTLLLNHDLDSQGEVLSVQLERAS